MLSAIFVERPRLAIVIAVVTTIAGLLALYAMPVAQYPDIVPPQVSVTTNYPGASADVVDATIAQPIEAQVIGVDHMMYMKSVSGNDGSYTLTASFELGTNPDINTVNVNNRVQVALSSLPQEVQRQGGGFMGAAINVGEVYAHLVRDIHAGTNSTPGFAHALHNARLIETVRRAAERGERQTVTN
jgi:multidrug efflux pump subunit AcrB